MNFKAKKSWRIFSIALAFAFVFTTASAAALTADAATVKPKSLTISATAKTVDIGGKVTVKVKSVKPANASKSVAWKSSDKKVATVTSKGVVKGIKKGTVKITATSKADKKVKKTITIKVKNIKPTGITLDKKELMLYEEGKTAALKAKLAPAGVYNKGIKWSVSDEEIISVDEKGIVTPKKAGTAVVTAKTVEGGLAAECAVTVAEATDYKVLKPYTLVGYYAKDKINYVPVASDASVQMWDAATDKFEYVPYTKANIVGNYVQLIDLDNDKKADVLQVVKVKDGIKKWDSKMQWLDGAGEKAEPAVSNEMGRKLFEGAEYRIPMGQRLLEGYGLGDYSGTTDFSIPAKQDTYYKDYDFYNAKSSKNLTILPNYKTQLQTTGWTCVLSTAISVLDWYGQRGDLNEEDLAALRSDKRKRMEGATSLKERAKVFNKLETLDLTCAWTVESSFDDPEKIYDTAWIKAHLEAGHPIMTIWNSYGGHGQTIIGYDDMGTTVTSDDVLIMMDPYDTTDHNPDGYIIQSYEKWCYGLSDYAADNIQSVRYLVAYPKNAADWNYKVDRSGAGFADIKSNTFKHKAENKLNSKLLEQTKLDLAKYYPTKEGEESALADWIYMNWDKGVGGPLGIEDTEYSGNYNYSPYYNFYDYYNGDGPTKTLKILKNYKTIQQSTEWTCGCTSALMAMEWFGMNNGETPKTDVSLSYSRQDKEAGATYLKGMKQLFDKKDWYVFSIDDLTDPDSEESYINGYCLQAGADSKGLIPYLISNGIPMMIGSDDWGGHWQTIIGYDDMGTSGTQDDVLILADSYDTTDHEQDGYVVKSFERLVFGWNVQFETWNDKWGSGQDYNNFIVAFPRTAKYENVAKELGVK